MVRRVSLTSAQRRLPASRRNQLCAGLAAGFLLAALATSCSNAPHTSHPGHEQSTRTPGLAASESPKSVHRFLVHTMRVREASGVPLRRIAALLVHGKRLWVIGERGPMEPRARLIEARLDGSIISQAAVGGAPIDIAADADGVWVANGNGDSSRPTFAAGTVWQFDRQLSRTSIRYAVPSIQAVVPAAHGAVAVSLGGAGPVLVTRLNAGHSRLLLRIATKSITGTIVTTSCRGELALATAVDDGTALYVAPIDDPGNLRERVLHKAGEIALSCSPHRLVVTISNVADGGIYTADFKLRHLKRLGRQRTATCAVMLGPSVWSVAPAAGSDRSTARPLLGKRRGKSISIPGTVSSCASSGHRLWIGTGNLVTWLKRD
jgi:hypothetical protein